MTDQEKWNAAVASVVAEFEKISPQVMDRLKDLLSRIKSVKERVHAFAEQVNVSEICAACRGECCATGKHHFTVVDLLMYLVTERELIVPRFDSGLCPYLGDRGCLMEPPYRPYNCITFNCDRVDSLLDPLEQQRFMEAERDLRKCYGEMDALFGNRFMPGLLIGYERDHLQNRGSLLHATVRDYVGVPGNKQK